MEEKEEQFDSVDMAEIEKMLSINKDRQQRLEEKTKRISLSDIEFEDSDISKQRASFNDIFNSKPSVGVICAQSGYGAKLSSLVYRDIVAITNSNLTNYENKDAIYKTIYTKITSYSVPEWKPSYKEWLAMTSLGDVETLLYGVYCATFPGSNLVQYDCPYCGEINRISIDNSKLIRVNDRQEMADLTDKISREASTVDKVKEFSLVSDKEENTDCIILPDSELIVILKMPTLSDTLEFLRMFKEEEIAEKTNDSINILLSIKNVAVKNKDTGKYSYIKNKSDIFKLIDMLSPDDYAVMKNVVIKKLDTKHISYRIEKQVCSNPKCKKEIDYIPVDIESLLFFQISEKQLS